MCTQKEDVTGSIQYAKKALHCLPLKDSIWRSDAAMALGFGYGFAGVGNFKEAYHAFSKAMEISREAGNIYVHIFALACLGGVVGMRGQLSDAFEICQEGLSLAQEHGLIQTSSAGSLHGTLGWIYSEWHEFDRAIAHLNKGIELSIQNRDPFFLTSSRWNLMKTLIHRGDYVTAEGLLKELNAGAREVPLPAWMANTVSAFNALYELARGNMEAAARWIKQRGLRVDDKLDNRRQIEHLVLAEILIAQNRLDEADSFLQRLIEDTRAGDKIYIMIQMQLLRALVLNLKGDTTAALIEMEQALTLAEHGGFITIFASRGKPVADLLEIIVRRKKRDQISTEAHFSLSYLRRILSALRAASPQKNNALIEPLSGREQEVLYLIAAGLTNKEIAEKLFISLNTVRTHTKNINSKLNVNSRIKAVARAKELGVI
jgi:LuxR family maltose regulon positive regulatory protein